MGKILKHVILDIVRNRTILVYTLLLGLLTWSSFALEDNSAKGMLTVLNILLLTVPLVSIFFSTIYLYNSGEFIELLLSHPLRRAGIWTGLFLGLSFSLISAFLVGVGIPLLIFMDTPLALTTIVMGCLLSAAFVSLSMLCFLFSRDKARGIGLAIVLWLYFSLLFDGLVLFLLFQFADYPVESFMVLFTCLSPIDLARIFILLQLDASALLGYSGAVFRNILGTSAGTMIAILLLTAWIAVPFLFSLRRFKNRDL